VSYLLFITIATMIGAIGIITVSVFLVIGAMVVGPEYGPLAGICVALIERRPRVALTSLKALLIGFSFGIVAAGVLTVVLKVTGIAPDALLGDTSNRQLTLFISHPNWYSAIVGVLAGIVGMLALVSAKSGALIGVLISVTTIPAAANVGVAASYGEWNEASAPPRSSRSMWLPSSAADWRSCGSPNRSVCAGRNGAPRTQPANGCLFAIPSSSLPSQTGLDQ
jgi:uncharacterized hydrophobic protein (TIGR00271 family)